MEPEELSFDEWYEINEEEINIELGETGADRELDFDPEREFDERYEKYINSNVFGIKKHICKNCRYLIETKIYLPYEGVKNNCIHDDLLWTKNINEYVCEYFTDKKN